MKRSEIQNLNIEILYSNTDIMKSQIIKDNKKKCGIYLWTNILSGKIYVGSSTNLGIRFKDYFNYSHISNIKRSNSNIHKALIKYGYSNFQLEIIEYCKADKCIEREQYYIELLQPEYNILKTAGSSKGYKHTKEALDKIRKHLIKYNATKKLPVVITDTQTNIITNYESIVATAAALNTNEKNIRYAEKTNKLLLNRYLVKIIRNP
jgi:hypothetical protein